MKLVINIALFFFISLMIFQNHLILAFVAVLLFTYRCGAVWLLPLAFLIDGYFGAFSQIPIISIVATLWYLISELVRPRLLMQYGTYEKAS